MYLNIINGLNINIFCDYGGTDIFILYTTTSVERVIDFEDQFVININQQIHKTHCGIFCDQEK